LLCSKVVGAAGRSAVVHGRVSNCGKCNCELGRRSVDSLALRLRSVSCAALVPVIMARAPSPASTRFFGRIFLTSFLLLAAFLGGSGLAAAGGELRRALRTKTEKALALVLTDCGTLAGARTPPPIPLLQLCEAQASATHSPTRRLCPAAFATAGPARNASSC